jgi:hypothetical protein
VTAVDSKSVGRFDQKLAVQRLFPCLRPSSWPHAGGGFPIGLAKTQHLDKQRDSEKKEKRHSKELREKRPNPGSFWFTAVSGIFFSDTRESRAKPELGLARERAEPSRS